MRLTPDRHIDFAESWMRALGSAVAVYGLIALTGCCKEQAQRYVYDLGNQYQCTQDAQNLPDESSRRLACTSPAQSGRPSFDSYRSQTEDPPK